MSDPLLEVGFSGGVDESTQEEVLDPNLAFTALENGRYLKKGGYVKRSGYVTASSDGTDATALRRLDSANLASGTSISFTARSAGRRILTNADQLCVIDGTYLDASSPAVDGWVNRGRVPEASYRHLEVPTVGSDDDQVDDVVTVGNVVVLAYSLFELSGANLVCTGVAVVLDAQTNAVIRSPEAIASNSAGTNWTSHLAVYGNIVVFFVHDFQANAIKAYYLDATSRTTIAAGWTSIGTIASDATTVHICVASQTDRVAVVYANTSAGASRLTVKTLTSAGVSQTATINTSSITPAGPSLSEGGATLWVAWAEESGSPSVTTNFKVCGLNPSNLASVTATTATVIQTVRTNIGAGVTWLVSTGSTSGVLYAINENVFASDGVIVRGFDISAGATHPLDFDYKFCNSVPLGRPFYRGGRVYMPLGSSNYEEYVLCDVTPPTVFFAWRPVAVPIQRGVLSLITANPRARFAATSSTTYVHAFNVLRAGSVVSGVTGAALVEFDFASPYMWKPAALNGSTFLSGGVTALFDGQKVFEAAFLCRPPPPTINVAAAGSQTFTLGGRSYVATYEHLDADGNWHVSGVSNPVSTGNITSKTVDVAVAPLSLTYRNEDIIAPTGSGVRIGIWVTTDGGEEPYYRLTTLANSVYNELVHFNDNKSEPEFTSNQLLYGTGNLPGTGAGQDHRAPPGLLYHVSYNGMLVGVTGKNVYYSGQPIDGEGTWFSPVFVQSIDDDASGITIQDGNVVVFTEHGAWITSGTPPSDNALQGGLSTPRKLAVDVGCINANSIVTTDRGTFFQSDRGIELLNRSLSVEYIGQPKQDTLATYPIVTSAVLDTANALVRFSLAASQTDGVASANGVDIVFDLTLGVWISTDIKQGSTTTQASQDACIATTFGARRYCWLSTGGIVYMEREDDDAARCLDNGSTWITRTAVTPWLRLGGFQGEAYIEKVLVLAKRVTGHDLTVSVAFDYEDAFTETRVFSASTIAGELREWLEAGLERAQMSAIRVKLQDATPSSGTVGTGEGGPWIGLTFVGQPHRGSRRSTATQRSG